MKDTMLQSLIQWRRHWNIKAGYGWPGKSIYAPIKTHYPNLVAELDYSVPWLYIMAEFADVSPEIMAAVLEDGEELSFSELWRLSQYIHAPCGYLTAPLQIIDPKTKKGKFRRRQLFNLIEQAKAFKQEIIKWWQIERIRDALQCGNIVTYAAYRWAVIELQEEISRQERARHKPRSYRRLA